ncbi:MAG: S9 family peptidase [Proteobacteria bacterium]|nr:S9 family peptidase [Pseudomonadota bacterium]
MLPPDLIIPRKVLWADPQIHLARISPDGKHICYLAPSRKNMNVWFAPSQAWQNAKVVSSSLHPVRDVWWSRDSDHILYTTDLNGDENWQLHSYQLSTQKTRTFTPQGLQVRVLRVSTKHPTKLLIGLNERDRQHVDVYVLDLNSSELTCVYQNNEYWDFLADDDLQIRIGLKVDQNGGSYINLANQQLITRTTLHDIYEVYFYPRLRQGLSSDNEKLYLCQSAKTNTSELISIDMKSGKLESLFHDEQSDIADVLRCPLTKKPLAAATYYERKKWHPLSQECAGDFEYLASVDNGDIDILSQSANNDTWMVSYTHDDSPATYYLYHRKHQRAIFLFNSHEGYKDYAFTKMHPRVITTRDGLKCVSYLSLPRQSDINEKGIPFKPVPLVLLVHGGPNYRDFWGFNPTHQWLANRGYAVLSMNYRSSTGFGKEHVQKGFGEWAAKIHEDLLDAVNFAIDNHITTADQVAIMGRSFGGYATLVGLSFTPEVFCCGVDIVGPSNLQTMLENFPPYWRTVREALYKMVGFDPTSEQGIARLHAKSPLFKAQNICKPLLIGHGANDVRVLQSESDQMVKAMQKNGIPVTYAVFPDEGHQLLHPGNRMAFYALAELFLAKVLKGKCESYDAAVDTSMTVLADDFKLLHN